MEEVDNLLGYVCGWGFHRELMDLLMQVNDTLTKSFQVSPGIH